MPIPLMPGTDVTRREDDLDLTADDVVVEQALALGATVFRPKGACPLGSSESALEWAVMVGPVGYNFCRIRDRIDWRSAALLHVSAQGSMSSLWNAAAEQFCVNGRGGR